MEQCVCIYCIDNTYQRYNEDRGIAQIPLLRTVLYGSQTGIRVFRVMENGLKAKHECVFDATHEFEQSPYKLEMRMPEIILSSM